MRIRKGKYKKRDRDLCAWENVRGTRGFGRISEIFNAFYALRVNHFIRAAYYMSQRERRKKKKCVSHFIAPHNVSGNKVHCTYYFRAREVKARFFASHSRDPFYFGAILNRAIFFYAAFSSLTKIYVGGSLNRIAHWNNYSWAQFIEDSARSEYLEFLKRENVKPYSVHEGHFWCALSILLRISAIKIILKQIILRIYYSSLYLGRRHINFFFKYFQ